MSDRENRFNLFKKQSSGSNVFSNFKAGFKNKIKSDNDDENKSGDGIKDYSSFASFDSIIPENSPLKKNSNLDSGFYNDDIARKPNSNLENVLEDDSGKDWGNDLDGVDEKYAKYIFSDDSKNQNALNDIDDVYSNNSIKRSKNGSNEFEKGWNKKEMGERGWNDFDDIRNIGNSDDFRTDSSGKLKKRLMAFKKRLLNKDNSSKNLFGKVTFLLIFLVLISSIFYFFVYQPFQDELNLERNSKLNELNALYKGPLEINENYYTLENRINHAYDIEELKSIDVMRSATKDWRLYHSSKIVSCKDDFGRVMMSYGDNKNIIMSVKDANDFVGDNDAKILSNVQFEKVSTVIVPISISRLQATAGLISVGSVVDIYSLDENSSEYGYGMESDSLGSNGQDLEGNEVSNQSLDDNQSANGTLEKLETSGETMNDNEVDYGDGESLETMDEGPLVSGATVLAILRSKDSGLVDSTVSKSNTIIKGNETNPHENTSTFSSDVEELLKSAVLNSNSDDNALDSYLTNYGVRLSNFERMSNLGDLDSSYLILLEVPQSDVNFVINNMDNLILTIPTDFAPNWALTELNETYYENLYQNQTYDFF